MGFPSLVNQRVIRIARVNFHEQWGVLATDRRVRLQDAIDAAANNDFIHDLKLLRNRPLLPAAPDQREPRATLDRLAKEWRPWTSLGAE